MSVLEFQFGFTKLGCPLWEWELIEAKPSEGWWKALWTLWTERSDTDSPARACCEVLVTFLFFSGPQLSHLEWNKVGEQPSDENGFLSSNFSLFGDHLQPLVPKCSLLIFCKSLYPPRGFPTTLDKAYEEASSG